MGYWIEPLTLDQTVAGSIPSQCLALLSFEARRFIHIVALYPGVGTILPGRMRTLFQKNVA